MSKMNSLKWHLGIQSRKDAINVMKDVKDNIKLDLSSIK